MASAGWIKIDAPTPDKPEVFLMAESLGIDPDAVLGKLIRVWLWADQQTYDGNAGTVTRALLDRVAGVTDFAQAMENAGWLASKRGVLIFTNFERHNGNTAKNRALTQKRVEKHRNAPSVTSALPDKIREDKIRKPYSKENKVGAGKPPPGPVTSDFMAVWNGTPGLRKVRDMTKGRTTALRARMAESFFVDNWRAAIAGISKSKFCTGENDRGWVATVDWFLRPDVAAKIIEGSYENKTRSGKSSDIARSEAVANQISMVRSLLSGGDEMDVAMACVPKIYSADVMAALKA